MPLKQHSHSWPARPQRAFTLVEIAVVVLIIGILAALALPNYRKIIIKSKATTAVNDLRTFASAFSNFNLANGRYPTASGVPGDRGEIGNGVTEMFTKTSTLGGKYLWHADSTYKAAVGIATDGGAVLSDDLDLLTMVDQLIDDGDLNQGNLTYIPGELIYTIEK